MVRTSIIFGVVALGMLAFILLAERGSLTSGELERRQGRVLTRFVRDRITQVEIQRKGVTTVLRRTPDAENDLDLGLWQLHAPLEVEADQAAVGVLLGELEWMDARRRLEDIDEADRKRFGFEAPRYRVRFVAGAEQGRLVVGKDTPTGDGTYVETGESRVAYVVGKDLIEALDQDPTHYHTKELHEGFSLGTVEKLLLRGAQGEVRIEAEDQDFVIKAPGPGMASRPAVDELVKALERLEATRYGAADIEPAHGLDRPTLDVELTVKRFDEETKEKGREQIRFRLGGPCADHAGERYLVVGDRGPVMCVGEDAIAGARKDGGALRELRLLPLEDGDVEGLTLEAGGKRLTLRTKQPSGEGDAPKGPEHADHDKEAEPSLPDAAPGFEYVVTRAGKKVAEGDAEQDNVFRWFKALRSTVASSWTAATEAELAQQGLAEPRVRLAVERKHGSGPYELGVGHGDLQQVFARRGLELGLLSFAAGSLDQLEPSAAAFRSLQLLSLPSTSVEELEVVAQGLRQRLVLEGQGWTVVEPVQAPADPVLAQEVARLLAGLTAERFDADEERSLHGFDQAAHSLELRFGGKDRPDGDWPHRLRLGAPAAAGGRYAQLDGGPAVFVLPARLSGLLAQPLISRRWLSTPVEKLQAATLSAGKRRLAIERRTQGFAIAGGEGEAEARAQDFADLLATLHAEGALGYTAQSRGRPQLRIQIERDGGPPFELLLAAPDSQGGPATGWRSDSPTTFRVSSDLLQRFEALLEPGVR